MSPFTIDFRREIAKMVSLLLVYILLPPLKFTKRLNYNFFTIFCVSLISYSGRINSKIQSTLSCFLQLVQSSLVFPKGSEVSANEKVE